MHVVQRPPPSSRNQAGATGVGAPPGRGQHHDGRGVPRAGETNSFVLGSFSLPADSADPNQVQVMSKTYILKYINTHIYVYVYVYICMVCTVYTLCV